MKTQFDSRVRVVSLENLRAMCEYVSGMTHWYAVQSVSRSRVTVSYSNPDEYGASHPVSAVFPCYPGEGGEADNPSVVLSALRFIGLREDKGEDYQLFSDLLDCPELFRKGHEGADWHAYPLETELRAIERAILNADTAKRADASWFETVAAIPKVLRERLHAQLKAELGRAPAVLASKVARAKSREA